MISQKKNYSTNKEIRIKAPMLRSDLCNFSDAYIVMKGDITVTNPNNAKRNKAVAFKNNAPFINCISKINGVKIDNAEDLDVVMPMYNLLEYSKNYKKILQVLQEILIMLMMMMMMIIMMQTKLVKKKLKLLFH